MYENKIKHIQEEKVKDRNLYVCVCVCGFVYMKGIPREGGGIK